MVVTSARAGALPPRGGAGLALDLVTGTQLVFLDCGLGHEDIVGARQVTGGALAEEAASPVGQFKDAGGGSAGSRFPLDWRFADCRAAGRLDRMFSGVTAPWAPSTAATSATPGGAPLT